MNQLHLSTSVKNGQFTIICDFLKSIPMSFPFQEALRYSPLPAIKIIHITLQFPCLSRISGWIFFLKPKQHMGRGVLLQNQHGLHDVSINTRKSGPVQPLFSVGSPPAGPGHLLTVHPPSSWIPKSLISNYLIFGFTSFSSVSSSLSSTCWMTKSLEPSSTISTSDLLSSP